MINLGKVFETAGMTERTAKSQASRLINKTGVVVNEGLISVEDFLTITADYFTEEKTSKYKATMVAIIGEIKEGKIKDEWKQKTVASATKNPFIDAKVLGAVVELATAKGYKDVLALVEKVRAELNKD